ncbi:hypothetical protein [Actinocrispum sp. NPDC049592]|uniref:hypothetical protein n=1 Tax=Actinocrispum sp. NPDC049592 TaxID=3154835 RepID=UPI00343F8F32
MEDHISPTVEVVRRLMKQAATRQLERQEAQAATFEQARKSLRDTSRKAMAWLEKTVEKAGKGAVQLHRQAAPPNWNLGQGDDPLPWTFPMAARLSLRTGIPLAWAPDPETVELLVLSGASATEETLRGILASRTLVILDHCQKMLDLLSTTNKATAAHRQMIEVAQQSVTALRQGLISPAQSSAGNLIDYLLRKLFSPMVQNSKQMYYRVAKEHVEQMAREKVFPLKLLLAVREVTALMPVPLALAEWWPHKQDPLPTWFSRHATAHAVVAPDQVNAVNALVAVMMAVSLLCQEVDSGWAMISPARREATLAAIQERRQLPATEAGTA